MVAAHRKAIRRLQIDDNKMISGGDDAVIRTWDLRRLAPSEPEFANLDFANLEIQSLCEFRMAADVSGRVSALQFDATRLITAFTLGTTTNGAHVRRGSINIWDLNTMTPEESGTEQQHSYK